jgi:hypothetical protein
MCFLKQNWARRTVNVNRVKFCLVTVKTSLEFQGDCHDCNCEKETGNNLDSSMYVSYQKYGMILVPPVVEDFD